MLQIFDIVEHQGNEKESKIFSSTENQFITFEGLSHGTNFKRYNTIKVTSKMSAIPFFKFPIPHMAMTHFD